MPPLKALAAFLSDLCLKPSRFQPLMSRDFIAALPDSGAAAAAERLLADVRSGDGTPLFEIDKGAAISLSC